MKDFLIVLVTALPLIIAAVIACVLIRKKTWEKAYEEGCVTTKAESDKIIGDAGTEAKRIVSESLKEGENKKREYLLAAKEEIHRSRIELEHEIKERRNEIQRNERRLIQKEETLDKKLEIQDQRESQLNEKAAELAKNEEAVKETLQKQISELERVAGMSRDEAKALLLTNIENELEREKVALIKEYETKLKNESVDRARDILSTAIQRCAADYVSEATISVVQIPNDEMKGRIIGREGRNIRALETLTGIDLIIDDTPESVVLSGYDPVRREVARIALEKLIQDGRIHPARIEEMVEKAKKEVDQVIRQEGENATYETGVYGLHS